MTNQRRIQAAEVRQICGGISEATLYRRANDPALNFPKPVYIGRIRYWKEADILAWLDAQAEDAA